MLKMVLTIVVLLVSVNTAFGWQGYNLDTGGVIYVDPKLGQKTLTTGNVKYFDYDTGQEKLGYLNMYEDNLGLLMDLRTGDLMRVKMEGRK